MNILVVDDERLIVQGITRHLQKMPDVSLQVVGAYSAREALDVMEYFTPDLLVTDIRMPGMDGLELVARVRQRGICDKFIILTAHEVFEYARQAVENQVLNYLVKPVDWAILEGHVRELTAARGAKLDAGKVLGEHKGLWAHLEQDGLSRPLQKITKYCRQNYAKNVSLVHLSVYSGLSENYICALFKKELGITFLDYIYELRLKTAMEQLLTEPERTIQDIARMVGYQSDRQFFRLFREKLDMTPQSFRDMYVQG